MKGCVFMDIQHEKNQVLEMRNRERFTVNLVENVERFQESEIVLKTALGKLRICGSSLRLEDLSKESGAIFLIGKIDTLSFSDTKEKRGFFRNLLK